MRASKRQDSRIGLFDGLDEAVVENFMQDLKRLKLKKGETIPLQIEGGEALYLVTSGSLEIIPKDAAKPGREPAQLIRAGEFCGELSLLSESAEETAAQAVEPAELLEIPLERFNRLSFSQPLVMLNVIRALFARLGGDDQKFTQLLVNMMQRNRLTTMGLTAGKITHDLITPLTVITLNAQLLETMYPDVADISQSIMQQARLMDEMIREVVDFVKGTPSEIVPGKVDMNSFLEELKETYGASLKGRNITLKIENHCHEPVYFDEERIRRVIINLLRNSSEALDGSGEISIVASLAANWLQISVIDDGPGIPESLSPQLFQPFFTFSKPNGTGLGLPICQKLVQEHHGRIEYSAGKPRGSRFDIRLPQNIDLEISR